MLKTQICVTRPLLCVKRYAGNGVEICCELPANRCKEGRSCLMGVKLIYFCAGRPVLRVNLERAAEVSVLRHVMPSCMTSCYPGASTCAAAWMCLVHHRLLFTGIGPVWSMRGYSSVLPVASTSPPSLLLCTDL